MILRRVGRCVLVATVLCVSAAPAPAVQSAIWEVHSRSHLEGGERVGVALGSAGVATLAPELESLGETGEFYIWSVVAAADDFYVGTGNGGKIYRLTGGKLTLHADLDEPDVLCLLWDTGVLYAGVSATGKVYRIDAAGEVSTFYETGEIYVWSIVRDREGSMIVGTGDKGRVHRVGPDGGGEVLYDSPETHIMALLPAVDGGVYAGSEGNGLIYRIGRDGDPFVVYDAAEKEIRRLVMDADGVLYAVALSGGGPGSGGPPVPMMIQGGQPPPSTGTGVLATDGGDAGGDSAAVPSQGASPGVPIVTLELPLQAGVVPAVGMRPPGHPSSGGAGGPASGSVLYRIEQDGVVLPIWRSAKAQLLALAITEDGQVLLGTGGENGGLHRVNPETEASTDLLAVDESQITTLTAVGRGGFLVGCANMAKLYLLGPGLRPEGTITSKAHDASTWAQWGRIWWEGNGIEMATRSGNSAEPDSTWSGWRNPEGRTGRIDNPNARFVQWRATLSKAGDRQPNLHSVALSYQQRNLKPRLSFVVLSTRPGGVSNRRGNGSPSPGGQPGPQRPQAPQAGGPGAATSPGGNGPVHGKVSIKWGGSDANGDDLEYAVYFRGKGETRWKVLEEEIRQTSHTWDTGSVPDGRYRVRVVASDGPSNGDRGLQTEKESEPFTIDNGAPELVGLEAKSRGDRITLTGVAIDAGSLLRKGVYVVDGGDPQPFFPEDGIFDSGREPFAIEVEAAGGEHTVVVRLTDRAGNVGAAKIVSSSGE